MRGENGDDELVGGSGDDQLDGGTGRDRLRGGAGNDILLGGTGDDQAEGEAGHDVIAGGNGNDILTGGDGDDVIEHGRGADSVSGGPGTDQCDGQQCEAGEEQLAPCAVDADCSGGQVCAAAGVCLACLADSECDDGNACTTDSCQPAVGCRQPPVVDGLPCPDSTVCNGAELCQSGACAAGTPLACDDALFCTGQETCDSVAGCQAGAPPVVDDDAVACTIDRCNEELDAVEHAPDHTACGAGYTCTASGCRNIDECALGLDNCSDHAVCSDHSPGVYGSLVVPPFACSCHVGYEGDGVDCAPRCDSVTVAGGAQRCVRSRSDATVDLRMSLLAPEWAGQYVQADEEAAGFRNYCGPTAVKNALFWYGNDAEYADLGAEMHTNTWDTGAVFGLVVGFGHLVFCIEPICWGALTAAISGPLFQAGTLPADMLWAMSRRAPPGYSACMQHGDPGIDRVYASLAAGNPVIFLESRGGSNLHWAVATGLYSSFGELRVQVANSANRSWDQFVTDWSLTRLDDFAEGAVRALLGFQSYTAIRWIEGEALPGGLCP